MGSVSMTSTLGLEAMNFINPDLMWKPSAKGYRSALRRPGKSVDRNHTAWLKLPNKRARKVVDNITSDTEKHGVAVLGCRFSDNVEQVPIKKRRFKSPSCSPQFEAAESNLNGKQSRRTTKSFTKSKLRRKASEVKYNKFDYIDCFSGIEILADVACSKSKIVDGYTDEGSSLMEETAREGVDSSASAVLFDENAPSSRDPVCEYRTEASSPMDSEITVSQKSPCNKDIRGMDGYAPSRECRLHWDLNVAMEAWDQPCDTLSGDSEENSVENNFRAMDEKMQMLESHGLDSERKYIEHEPLGSVDSNKSVHSTIVNSQEASICDITGAKVSSKIVDVDASVDHSACPAAVEENRGVSPSGLNIKRGTESVPGEACNDASPYMAGLERNTCNIDCTILNDGTNSGEVLESHEDNKSSQHDISLVGSQPVVPALLPVKHENEAEKSGNHQFSPNCKESSVPGVFAVEGKLINVKGTDNEAYVVNTVEDSPMDNRSKEIMQKSSVDSAVAPREECSVHEVDASGSGGNVSTGDPSDDSYKSDSHQDDKTQMVEADSNTQLDADYDSQIEAGELRESDAQYCWDENEDEDVELVDYGSELEEERPCGADNLKEQKDDSRSGPVSGNMTRKTDNCKIADALKDEFMSSKTKISDVKSSRELPSGIKGSNEIRREDTIMRNRYANVCRDDLEFDGDVSYMHGRTPGGRYVNPSAAYWDSERRPPYTYGGSCTLGMPKPNYMESRGRITSAYHRDSVAKGFTGFGNRVHRPFVNSAYEGGHEYTTRHRSPINRNSAYGMHRTSRDISPRRSRYRRYPRELDGGDEGEYYRTSPIENYEYPNRGAHRISRRERSISRSRSRSPASYFTSREQIQDSRFWSRSPDLRSDARMSRARLPVRKRFATHHNDRLSEDSYAVDDFRRRKSPVSMIRQNQRSEWNSHDQFKPLNQSRKFFDNSGTAAGRDYRGSGNDTWKRGS